MKEKGLRYNIRVSWDCKITKQLSESQMFVLKLAQIYWLHSYFLQRFPNQCLKRADMIFSFQVQFLVHNPARHKST